MYINAHICASREMIFPRSLLVSFSPSLVLFLSLPLFVFLFLTCFSFLLSLILYVEILCIVAGVAVFRYSVDSSLLLSRFLSLSLSRFLSLSLSLSMWAFCVYLQE